MEPTWEGDWANQTFGVGNVYRLAEYEPRTKLAREGAAAERRRAPLGFRAPDPVAKRRRRADTTR